jgi:hypothetical protein
MNEIEKSLEGITPSAAIELFKQSFAVFEKDAIQDTNKSAQRKARVAVGSLIKELRNFKKISQATVASLPIRKKSTEAVS